MHGEKRIPPITENPLEDGFVLEPMSFKDIEYEAEKLAKFLGIENLNVRNCISQDEIIIELPSDLLLEDYGTIYDEFKNYAVLILTEDNDPYLHILGKYAAISRAFFTEQKLSVLKDFKETFKENHSRSTYICNRKSAIKYSHIACGQEINWRRIDKKTRKTIEQFIVNRKIWSYSLAEEFCKSIGIKSESQTDVICSLLGGGRINKWSRNRYTYHYPQNTAYGTEGYNSHFNWKTLDTLITYKQIVVYDESKEQFSTDLDYQLSKEIIGKAKEFLKTKNISGWKFLYTPK